MRRAKADLMKSAINSYLKRRHYGEPAEQSAAGATGPEGAVAQSSQQMAVICAVEKELCRSNSFSFSSVANDRGREAEHQFSRLKGWIAHHKADGHHRYELAALLCPLFCHLYLEMLCAAGGGGAGGGGGHAEWATEFFMRHQALFASREGSRRLLEELSSVSSSQDIEANAYIKAFRAGKYRLRLSTRAMAALQKYLSEHGHLLLLQTLQKWFDVDIAPPPPPAPSRPDGGGEKEGEEEDDDDDDDDAEEQQQRRRPAPAPGPAAIREGADEDGEEDDDEEEGEDDCLRRVLEVIRAVEEQQPSPLLLYVIANVVHNGCRLYSAKTDDATGVLGAALNNTVKLWGLSRRLRGQPRSCSTVLLRTKQQPQQPQQQADASVHFRDGAAAEVTLHGHSGPVQDVAFVPAAAAAPELLLSVSQDATMRVWRLDGSYENVAAYRGHNHPIWCVDVSSLGLFVATGSRDRTARIWTLDRNFPLRTCAGHHLDVECIKFHPNNLYFATGSADKTVKMWSVNDARLLRLFFGHRGAIRSLAFSPDGKFLASAAEDKRIKIWDLTAGKLFRELYGHASAVLSLAWDKTNEHLASCSTDGTVRLWDVGGNRATASESESSSSDVVTTYTVGGGVFSVQYSVSNTLVCVAVS